MWRHFEIPVTKAWRKLRYCRCYCLWLGCFSGSVLWLSIFQSLRSASVVLCPVISFVLVSFVELWPWEDVSGVHYMDLCTPVFLYVEVMSIDLFGMSWGFQMLTTKWSTVPMMGQQRLISEVKHSFARVKRLWFFVGRIRRVKGKQSGHNMPRLKSHMKEYMLTAQMLLGALVFWYTRHLWLHPV